MTKNDNNIREKIINGLKLTHKRLIQSKKDRNLELVISENGKVIKVSGKDLK